MTIVGFNYTKIAVEKKNPIKQSVKVKNDMIIENIKKTDLNIGGKEDVLQIDFLYSAEYQPNIAKIELKGNVLYLAEGSHKAILTHWTTKKKLPADVASQILNAILIKCGVKALSLSQDLNLPPHIRLPTIAPKVNKKDYVA